MRLDNYIAQSIRAYPDLYRDITYEKSRIKVLDHLFLVNGNGLVWQQGQLIDKNNPIKASYSSELTFESDYFTKEIIETITYPHIEREVQYNLESKHKWNPYPICQYAKIVNIPDNICSDWLAGAKEIHKYTVAFYLCQPEELIKKWNYMHKQPWSVIQEHLNEQCSWLTKIKDRLIELERR